MKKIIIAIDGPSGSGKSTTARETARKLGYIYIDTGAMYRAVTLAAINAKIEFTDNEFIKLFENLNIELKQSDSGQRTFLNGIDVSETIRHPEITELVSPVSANGIVRTKMVELQRELGKNGGVVMDGRDIGTVVFQNADLKIFMVCNIEARGIRRAHELNLAGINANSTDIMYQLEARDKYDSSREISPLKKADDAIEIDTSDITIEEQTEKVYQLSMNKINAE